MRCVGTRGCAYNERPIRALSVLIDDLPLLPTQLPSRVPLARTHPSGHTMSLQSYEVEDDERLCAEDGV